MYIPAPFEVKDKEKIISFIKQFPFATLVSNTQNYPVATHLPFILENETENSKFVLLSHLAAVNNHLQYLTENSETLIIFQGPHAYISPEFYENKKSVPTWNYTSVHVYGKIKFIEEEKPKYQFLEKLVTYFEPTFITQYKNLPSQYLNALMQEIKVFKIEVSSFEACFKLSQNKSINDQLNIISQLKLSENFPEKELADFMKKNLNS